MSKINGAMNAAIEIITQSAPRTLSFEEMAEIIHREAVAPLLDALVIIEAESGCTSDDPQDAWCPSCRARAAIARYEEGP